MISNHDGEPNKAILADIGLVSYDSLGDGLIYLMMADNLRRNGFDVTYYGGRTSQLAMWLPQLSIKPYPGLSDLRSKLDRHDLVLFCPPSFIRHRWSKEDMRRLAERYVIICQTKKYPEYWRVDHTARVRRRLPASKFDRMLGLASCSGRIRQKKAHGRSVVEMTLSFMQKRMGLETVTKEVELHAPDGLKYRRFQDRVILMPDSATPERKDWTPARFLNLACKLEAKGLNPEIVVGPESIDAWQKMPENRYPTPDLPSVDTLAAYLFESGVVVANDSGGGHLASFLRIPTVTIHRRRNRRFAWRPDWGPGIVVRPLMTLNLFKAHVWRPFISTNEILRAIDKLMR